METTLKITGDDSVTIVEAIKQCDESGSATSSEIETSPTNPDQLSTERSMESETKENNTEAPLDGGSRPLDHNSIGDNQGTEHAPTENHQMSLSGSNEKAPDHSTSKSQSKTEGKGKTKVRNMPPLRVIKNNLRHLNFEETKAIRDWADNRLLTVLRPAVPLASGDADNTNLQPA